MKKLIGLSIAALAVFAACSVSTANLSSLKVSKTKDGNPETTTFKAGDVIYGTATVSNNPGKVTVKMYLVVDDAPGMEKGQTITNSEVKLDIDGDGSAKYNYPTYVSTKGGKFTMIAEMLNEAGEKKDSKSVAITVEPGSPAPPAASNSDTDEGKEEK